MISSAEEFVSRLLSYFKSTDEVSAELIDGLKAWIRRENFNDIELDKLYNIIQEECATFPMVKTVKKLWYEKGERFHKAQKVGNSKLEDLKKNAGWERIIDEVKDIRREQDIRELRASEIDILAYFDEFYYTWRLINEVPDKQFSQDEKATYMRKVLETFREGIPINLQSVKKHMEQRIKKYKQMYGAEEEEMCGRVTRTVDMVNQAFTQNSRALEPEPDNQQNLNFI
jgi:hypothetical protein